MSTEPPEGTRLALITAATELFGAQGFAATSTRQITARAGTNVASIAYHFGGKDALRLACAEEFARRFGSVVAEAPMSQPDSPQTARAALSQVLAHMVGFIVGSDAAGQLVPFMLREIAEDGPGMDRIYHSLMEPTHRRLCGFWAIATGQEAESPATKLAVFSLVGQVLYFRIGSELVRRRMGWDRIGPAETSQIVAQLLHNLDAVMTASTEV